MRVRCPNCHDSTEVDDNTELSNIACQSCGGEFSLVGEETITLDQTKVQTVGHFELVDQLGTGAFGSVWLARDAQLDRSVAVKIPRKGQLDPSETEQFIREARAAAQLKHPNIVAVHEVGREDGQVYIVSDYVEGLTLADWLVAQQLAARTAAELCVKIAEALHHAHEAGVIHRDLKPTNIIIDRDNEPHILDFGLAKREAGEVTMTMEGKVLGTPAYMSPEQAKGEAHQADRRSDVYSLGVILYELLTGHKPFRGNVRMLLQQVINEDAPSPSRLNSSIPGDLETVCLKCLEKTPARRYQSARDLADDLKRWLNREPIEARPIGRLERGMRWCHRRPMVASLVGAVIVVAAMGFGGVTWQWRKTEKAASAERAQRRIADKKSKAAAAAERHARQMAETRRQELYAAQVNLAHQAWGDGNLERAQTLLTLQRPDPNLPNQTDLRGFEWRYLWQLCQDESQRTLPSYSGGTDWLASDLMSFSADGDKLAIAEKEIIRVWEFPGFSELPTVDLKTEVTALVFSPKNPDLLATGDVDGTIKLWNLATSADPAILAKSTAPNSQKTMRRPVESLAFSPDGDKIVSATSDGQIVSWNVETWTQDWSNLAHWDTTVLSGKKKPARALCVAYSADRKHVASGGGDTNVRLWNAKTGELVGRSLKEHTAFVKTLEFSPDGKQLATGGFDGRVFLWDVTTRGAGNPRPLLGHRGIVKSVAFSPDGKTLVSGGGDSPIRCWSTLTGRQMRILRGHAGSIHSLAFSPDGQSLVSASGKTAKVWRATPHNSQDVFEHSGWVWAVVLSPDGKTLVTIDHHTLALKLWDVPSRGFVRNLRGHSDVPYSLAISPNGEFLVSGGVWGKNKTVRLWNLSAHKEEAVYECASEVKTVSFSADSRLVRALSGGRIKCWDIASRREFELFRGESRSINRAAFSPDDRLLAAHYDDGKVRVWDTDDWTEVASFKKNVGSLIFSSDGHIIAADGDGRISLFDVAKNEIVQEFPGNGVKAFTPDSKTLASAGWDGTTKLWNVASGQVALTLQHQGPVAGVTFSKDGMLMVTCGADGTARLWPTASLSEADAPLRAGTAEEPRTQK